MINGAQAGWEVGRDLRDFVDEKKRSSQFRKDVQGQQDDHGCEAHRIVAVTDRRAADSRKILWLANIDVNDAFNGAWLRKKGHAHIHTNQYHIDILLELQAAAPDWRKGKVDANAVMFTLGRIKARLEQQFRCVP